MLLLTLLFPFYIFYFLYQGLIKAKRKKLWYAAGLFAMLGLPLVYLKLDDQIITPILYHNSLLLLGFFALLGFLFASFINGITDRQLKNELQRKQLESELSYLKAQVNPHFLFNTLNNIDSLIGNDPELASQSLINLSDMMRYMIYDSASKLVPVQKELDYLAKVIALYRLRYKAEEPIDFRISGDAADHSIPPLLLLPIIENAFKHQSKKYSNEAIAIAINIENKVLTLTCSNPYDETAKTSADSGFGLETLQRRLALLFPGRYTFEIVPSRPIFKVSLQIPLT
jgi:LytS/YehU family sensor histidine kinase